jgi:hypothetical protein
MTEAVAMECYRCGTEDSEQFGDRADLCMDCEKAIEKRKQPRKPKPEGEPAAATAAIVALPGTGVPTAAVVAPPPSVVLSNTDAAMSASMEQLEGVIQTWVAGFAGVGAALFAIRDRKLYLDAHCKSFDEYCQERWGMVRRHADRLIAAAQMVDAVRPIGLIENEAQARELVIAYERAGGNREGEAAVRSIFGEAKSEYGQAITAKLLREKVQEHYPKQEQQADPTTSHDLEQHLDTISVEVIIHHKGEYDEARHMRRATDWHSGRFFLPANVEMPEAAAGLTPLWHSIASQGAKRMLEHPPITARWKRPE